MRGRMRSFDQGSTRAPARALPQATTRRAKRAALSNPSPPPSLSKVPELSSESAIRYSAHAGKDEKLRPRFDSSASERALPQATTRRAKRAALSNPSPPPSLSKVPELSSESAIKYSAHAGKDEKLRLRFDLSASERALPQATTRRAKRAALSNPSPPPSLP